MAFHGKLRSIHITKRAVGLFPAVFLISEYRAWYWKDLKSQAWVEKCSSISRCVHPSEHEALDLIPATVSHT